MIPFAALAVLAVVVVVVLSGRGVGGATKANSTSGFGPYLTASAIPQVLVNSPAPRFDLVNARGGTLSTAALSGKPYAITFLYVHCLTVCPLIGEEIHAALVDLGPKAAGMNVVAISVDYLIGSKSQLGPVWHAYHVAPQIADDPDSSHTALIWLVSRRNRLQALIDAGVALNTKDLAHDFGVLIKQA